MESSLIVALSAIVLSILSPIASAWINGHYRMKEKEAELTHAREQAALELAHAREQEERTFYLQHRAEVIERYISATGAVLKQSTSQNLSAYGAAKGEIYLYVEDYLWDQIDELDKHVSFSHEPEDDAAFRAICKELSYENVRPKNKPEPEQDSKK